MTQYNLPRGYLSASSISTYLRCGYQFKLRYVDGIIAPPNVAMTKGKAVHNTLEKYYGTVLEGGNRPEAKEIKDMSVEILEKEFKDNELNLPDEDKREIELISESYIDNVAKDIHPVGVEEEVRYTTNSGVDILAYLDLIHEKDDYIISDYKITGKKWGLKNLVNSLQFKIYALATGLDQIEVHNMVKTTKTPKVFNKQTEDGVWDIASNLRIINYSFVDDREEAFLEEQIEQVAKAISAGIFVPADPSDWCCSPDWCGYWNYCRGKKRGSM